MDNTFQAVGHTSFTWGAYLMSNWTEIGAAVLMLLQCIYLLLKMRDGYKKRYKEEKEVKKKDELTGKE